MSLKTTYLRAKAITLADEINKIEADLRNNLRATETTAKYRAETLAKLRVIGAVKYQLDRLTVL